MPPITRSAVAAFALVSVACARPSNAADELPPVEIHNGLSRGHDYRALSEREQWLYASALLEGIMLAPMFGANKARGSLLRRLEDCAEGMTNEQLAAILTKYLREHPERWHDYVHIIMYSALMDACRLKP
jgi:hypothetical protein